MSRFDRIFFIVIAIGLFGGLSAHIIAYIVELFV